MAEKRERYRWYDTTYWEEVGARSEQVADEEGDAVARAGVHFELYSLHLLFTLTPFRLAAIGRAPSDADGWLSMRPGVETRGVVIEASAPLAAVGYGAELERNRQIVNRALRLIDARASGASEQAREAAKALRERLLTPDPESASACSLTEDGNRPPWGERSKELGHEPKRGHRDFHLQHPLDNDFRNARLGLEDAALLELIDAWIENIERNYRELVRGIPAALLDHAELAFEASAEGAGDELMSGLPSPATMAVHRRQKGEVAEAEAVATQMLMLEQGVAPQPDGIAALPGERWWIQGHRLNDGTIMPCWGTYRVAGAATAAMTWTAPKGHSPDRP
jgi:hypothetical protein